MPHMFYTLIKGRVSKYRKYNGRLQHRRWLVSGVKKVHYVTIHTHGSSSSIKAIDSSGKVTHLKETTIKKGDNLTQLKVCYIAACSVAPVAKAIYSKGAKTTIGYTKTVNTQCNWYMHSSFNAYFTGAKQSVSKAMSSAKVTYIKNMENMEMLTLTLYMGIKSKNFRRNINEKVKISYFIFCHSFYHMI